MSGILDSFQPWIVGAISPVRNKKGHLTGFSGTLYTESLSGKRINTGITVNCGTAPAKRPGYAKPNNQWVSNEYQDGLK